MGNSATKVGYGCDQAALVSLWRSKWSSSSATAPLARFGLVTLAAGGSEGAGAHMAGMRWSQTANYGTLPNAKMPNTFLAQGYDLGDPWAKGGRRANCSHVNPATGAVDPGCVPWNEAEWNAVSARCVHVLTLCACVGVVCMLILYVCVGLVCMCWPCVHADLVCLLASMATLHFALDQTLTPCVCDYGAGCATSCFPRAQLVSHPFLHGSYPS
jgi:hypothetical protein